MIRLTRILSTILFMCLFGYAFSVNAQDSDGDKMIRLSGLLQENAPKHLTVKKLEADFTLKELRFYNPWEKSTDNYSGIFLEDLVAKYALPETQSIHFKSIDDYETDIKKSDWTKFRILLVTRKNRQYVPVSDKGPMRIVFPDYTPNSKDFEMDLYKWIWMINRIEFK